MAERLDKWVKKKEILAKFRGKAATLNNALKALRDREIILSMEGAPGVYRLQHRGFAWWIKMYTSERTDFQEIARDPVISEPASENPK